MARGIEAARIFYTINANTQGLERDLAGAEKQLGKLANYIRANPVAAAGALGVALVGIGAKAVQMAEQVEAGFRRLGALVPGLTANMKRAQQGIAALAEETGRSQQELLATSQEIAAQGVENTEDLLNRLRLVTNLAKVTGAETGTIAAGLDQVLDVFGLAADRATEISVKLFAMAKGKAPLEDLFAAIQGAAPGIREVGLGFDVAAQALTALLSRGNSPKQAAAEFKELAGQGARGAAELTRLAGAVQSGGEAFEVYDGALRTVNDTTTEQLRKLKVSWENFATFMGQKIVPVLTTVLGLLTPEGATIDAIIRRQIERGKAAGTGAPGAGGTGGTGGTGLGKAATKLREDLQHQLTAFSRDLMDEATAAVARFKERMREQLGELSAAERAALQPLVDQVTAGLQARVREAQVLARTAGLLKFTPREGGPAIPIRGVDRMNARFQEQLEREKEAEEQLARARQEAIQTAVAEAQMIEQAGRGALQLAEALGLVSAQGAEAAEALLQIGNSAVQLSALSKIPGGLTFENSLSGFLSIAGGLASLLGSLFGESPEEKRQREVQEDNTRAIEDLSRRIGELGSVLGGTSGNTIAAVQEALTKVWGESPANDPPGVATERWEHYKNRVRSALAELGVSMSDLEEVAKGLNITFANDFPTLTELKAVLDALAEAQITQFATTLTGQLQALRLEFELFDITNPIDQLRKLQEIAKRFGTGDPRKVPQVLAALGAIDISTEAGRAAADAEIQRIFALLQSGGLDKSLLGDFSVEQLLDFLREFEGLIDQATQQGGAQGETSQFAVQRTITEAQANLLASLLTSDAYWNEQTARNTAAIATALGASLPAGSLVPPAPSTTAAGGVTIDTLAVTITLPAGTDLSTGQAVGMAVAQGVTQGLDTLMGKQLRVRKLLAGNVVQV